MRGCAGQAHCQQLSALTEDDLMQQPLFASPPPEPEPLIFPHPALQPPQPDAGLTLPECYERHVVPLQFDSPPSTLADYRGTLRKWARYVGDLPLREIDEAAIARFRQRLEVDPNITSKATRAKHLKNVRHVLRVCGPQDSFHNPRGLGLISRLPFVAVPKVRKKDRVRRVRVISLEEVGRLYVAAIGARWPVCSIPAPVLWCTIVVLMYTYGLDPGDLFALEWEENVSFDEVCPDDEVDVVHPLGWLSYSRTKTGVELNLPLTPAVRAHLEELKSFTRHSRLLFPAEISRRDNSWLEERRRIQRAVGIATPYTFHELRKTANNTWRRIDRDLGLAVLGHREKGINAEFYTNTVPKILDHIDSYLTPPEFLAGLNSDLSTRQLSLDRGRQSRFHDPQLTLF